MAERDNKETRKEYKEFRELLRKGIGLRTQKEFANAVGISPAYINKMLKNDVIPTPTRETLNSLAKHMPSVKKEALLRACGYEVLSAEEEAEALVNDIIAFFNKNGCWIMHDTIEGTLDTINMLYCPQGYDAINFTILSDEAADVKGDAENMVKVAALWENRNVRCEAEFTVYYSKTVGNNLVIFKAAACPDENGKVVKVTDKENRRRVKEEAAYKLFGFYDLNVEDKLPDTLIGPGISYNKTPEGFKDFLSNHRAAFCTSKERCALWKRVVENGEDPNIVFKDFTDETDARGTGSAVAIILREETKDLRCMADYDVFRYYEPCMDIDEKTRNSFVMALDPYKVGCSNKELNMYLFSYAKELKADGFGICYYHNVVDKHKGAWFTVEEFAEKGSVK